MYRLVYKRSVAKDLRGIPRTDLKRIITSIEQLANEPRPRAAIKLQGKADVYRIRQGNYRVIYQIEHQIVTVIIIKVGHRKDVYD